MFSQVKLFVFTISIEIDEGFCAQDVTLPYFTVLLCHTGDLGVERRQCCRLQSFG